MKWFERPIAWFKRYEEHGNLMTAMFRRTGASFANADGLAAENTVRQAVDRCLACRDEEACKEWLDVAEPGAKPPSFCRNAQLIETLKAPQKAVWP
jgi:hypothetical protein